MKSQFVKTILIYVCVLISHTVFAQSNSNSGIGNINIKEVGNDAIIISTPKGNVTINKIYNNIKNVYEWKISDEDSKKLSYDIAMSVTKQLTGIIENLTKEIQNNNVILQAEMEKRITMKDKEIDSLKRQNLSLQNRVINLQSTNQYLYEKIIIQKMPTSLPVAKKHRMKKDRPTWQTRPYNGYWGCSFIGCVYSGFYGTNTSQSAIGGEFFGRHGNVMGWGWNAQAGYSFGSYYKNESNGLYASVTAKYFPYKFIYCGIAVSSISNYSYAIFENNVNFIIHNKNVLGISLLAGIEDYSEYIEDQVVGIYGSLGVGITYIPLIKSITPTIRASCSILSIGRVLKKKP